MMYSLPSVSLKYKHEIRPYIIPYALPLTQVKTGEKIKKFWTYLLSGFIDREYLHSCDGGSREVFQHL